MVVPVGFVGEGFVALFALLGVKVFASQTRGPISTTVALVATHVRSQIISAVDRHVGSAILREDMVSAPLVRFPFLLLHPEHSWVRIQTDLTRRSVW